MGWHATDALSEAYDATRDLLWPIVLRRWLVLAVVVFFVGWSSGTMGSWNVPTTGIPDMPVFVDFPTDIGPGPGPGWPDVGWSPAGPLIAPVAVALLGLATLVLGFAVAVIGSIMQFVFVRQLTEREIRIRGYFGASVGPGLRLFLLFIGLVVAFVAVAVVLLILTVVTFGLFLIVLILLFPLFFVAAAGLWVFVRFTLDFVVPIMLVDDVGVIEGWTRLYGELRTEWKQYGLYAGVRFVLDIGAAIVLAVVGMIILLLIGLPAVLAGFVFYTVVSAVSPVLATVVVAGLVVTVVLATAVVTTVVAGVPVQTYLRYYALFVLARISPAYDMLDEVRTALGDDVYPAE